MSKKLKRQMKNLQILKSLMTTIVLGFLFSPLIYASGLGLHVAMTERAMEELPPGEFKSLLSRYKTVYRNGSLFPDIGHLSKAPYAEWTHWAGYLNAYGEKFSQECSYPWNSKCEKLLVFYFGCLAHTVGDINFDRYFVTEVAKQDFDGNIDLAQNFTDRDMDFLTMKDLEDIQKKITFSFYQPTEFLLDIYQENGLNVDGQDLRRQDTLTKVIYIGMLSFAPHAYHRIASKNLWASQNYVEARGGFKETSERIKELWLKVWEKLSSTPDRKSFPRVYTDGGWPFVDYGIVEE